MSQWKLIYKQEPAMDMSMKPLQSSAAVGGKHLSEKCKAEYPRMVKYCLWILAEIAVIAADIPEVIGTTFGLNILFNIPVWVRKLEMLIAVLVFVMVGCFFREMSYVKPPASGTISSFTQLLCSAEKYQALLEVLNVLGKSSKALYAVALLASGQSSTITGTYAGQFIVQGFLNLHMKKWVRNIMTRCIAITPSLIVSIIGGSQGAGRLIIIASVRPWTRFFGPSLARFEYYVKVPSSARGVNIFSNREWHRLVCGVFNQRGGCLSVYAVCTADNISSANQKRCNDLNLNSASFLLQMILSFELPFALIPLLKFSSSSTKMGT
ncbi:hypothetical protein GOBAR_DD33190 [Gossypium barbadense]|nr:hypothetical protein GOBAR_DD33190 [Gossypium barbadense]